MRTSCLQDIDDPPTTSLPEPDREPETSQVNSNLLSACQQLSRSVADHETCIDSLIAADETTPVQEASVQYERSESVIVNAARATLDAPVHRWADMSFKYKAVSAHIHLFVERSTLLNALIERLSHDLDSVAADTPPVPSPRLGLRILGVPWMSRGKRRQP